MFNNKFINQNMTSMYIYIYIISLHDTISSASTTCRIEKQLHRTVPFIYNVQHCFGTENPEQVVLSKTKHIQEQCTTIENLIDQPAV